MQRLEAEEHIIDQAFIEDQISQATSSIDVHDGSCQKCTNAFAHWPTVTGSLETREIRNFGRTTMEVEATTRLGCRFCAFMLTRLKEEGKLHYWREIEGRLIRLGDRSTSSTFVSDHFNRQDIQSQMLNWRLPGTHAESRFALFESHVVPAHRKSLQCEVLERLTPDRRPIPQRP